MKLDRKVRDFPLFDLHVAPYADSTQPYQAIIYQRNIMFCIKESTLYHLHRYVFGPRQEAAILTERYRPFFVSALNEKLKDPLRSKFAGSVLAV